MEDPNNNNLIIALSEDELILDGRLDIYAFIRSDEVRDYFRRNKCFSVIDKEQIILYSFNPLDIKLKALKILLSEAEGKDRDAILTTIRIMELVIEKINDTSGENIFAVSESNPSTERNAFKASLPFACDFYHSLAEFMKDHDYEDNEGKTYFEICIVSPKVRYEFAEIIKFGAAYFGKKLEVFTFWVSDEFIEEHGFTESDLDRINTSKLYNYSLPFFYKDYVEIMTPFMEEPVRGYIESDLDAFGSWYHFLNIPDEDVSQNDSMDLRYHELGFSTHFTVFDWIKKVDDAPDNKFTDKCTAISGIHPGEYGLIRCRIKSATLKDSVAYVELEDDTGVIKGEIRADYGERWMLNMVGTGSELVIHGHFKEVDDKPYLEWHNDLYILD